jgi:hypothetical protein
MHMLKRLLYGLFFGLFVGALLAAAVIKGLGMVAFTGTGGAVLAYVFAAVTGVLVGLVAGKPIWASGGQIEAGLKATAGALVGAGAMFAMRRWLTLDLDLHSLGLGPLAAQEAGMLPATTLPLIAAVLGAFYEADNTPSEGDEKAPKSKGKDAAKNKVRVGGHQDAEEEDEELLEPPKKATKK